MLPEKCLKERVYMEIEISYLTRTAPGIKDCFCLHDILTADVSSI